MKKIGILLSVLITLVFASCNANYTVVNATSDTTIEQVVVQTEEDPTGTNLLSGTIAVGEEETFSVPAGVANIAILAEGSSVYWNDTQVFSGMQDVVFTCTDGNATVVAVSNITFGQ